LLTYSGYEVDAVIGNANVAIEIKSTEKVQSHHTRELKAFSEEFPNSRLIIVSMDKHPRRMNEIDVISVMNFLTMLWNGQLF
jgi:predicted AAA+ superfamily ATPase